MTTTTIPEVASARFTKEERAYIAGYVKLEKKPVGTLMREALLEKIDDFYDIREANKVLKEIEKDPSRVRPWSELQKELNDLD